MESEKTDVLVVDDNIFELQEAIEQIEAKTKEIGVAINLYKATTGIEAIKILKENNIKICVTDSGLPMRESDKTEMEVGMRILNEACNQGVITTMCTYYDLDDFSEEFQESHAGKIFSKKDWKGAVAKAFSQL